MLGGRELGGRRCTCTGWEGPANRSEYAGECAIQNQYRFLSSTINTKLLTVIGLPGPTDLTHSPLRRGKLQAVVRANWDIADGQYISDLEFDLTLTQLVIKRLLSFSASKGNNLICRSHASCPSPVFCAIDDLFKSYWNQCLLSTPQAPAISVWRTMIGTSQHRRLTLFPAAISSVKRWSYSNSRATICSSNARILMQ